MSKGIKDRLRKKLWRIFRKHRWIGVIWAMLHFHDHVSYVVKVRTQHKINKNKYAVKEGDALACFKNKYSGQRCFMIGNGSSLTLEDLESLKGEICFSFNAIVNLLHKTDWRPTFYVTGSPDFFGGKLERFVSEIPYYFILYNDVKNTSEYLRKRDNVFFYRRNVLSSYDSIMQTLGFFKNRWDMTKELGYSGTNLFCAINMAFYMGFKEIVLIGVDNIYGNEKYYFQNILSEAEQDNKGADYTHMNGFEGKVYDEGWYYLERISSKIGVKIYNATRGGKLEAFERKRLEELLIQ